MSLKLEPFKDANWQQDLGQSGACYSREIGTRGMI
jgi:hypothetical protein